MSARNWSFEVVAVCYGGAHKGAEETVRWRYYKEEQFAGVVVEKVSGRVINVVQRMNGAVA